jgi:hypothetical protein
MRAIYITAALAACSPYSPELGGEPFFCGSGAPQCPDGYTCKMDAMGKMVCVSTAAGGVDGASGFQCADDSMVEGPNRDDTIATAFSTPVALQMKMVTYDGLAICPASDKDYFRVDLTAMQNIEATLVYDDPSKPGAGALKMSIYNGMGASVVNATAVMGVPNTIRADAAMLPVASGPYYIEVEGDGTTENNYKLTIVVSP